MRHVLTELLLLALQTLKLATTLLLGHGLHAACQIALGPRQSFLAPGQLFELVGFLRLLTSASAAGTLRGLVTVLKLTHLHLEEFTQIFALLLRSAAAPATTGLLLGADIGAIDICLGLQNELQCDLLWLERAGDLLLVEFGDGERHLLNGLLQVEHGIVVTVVREVQPLGQTFDGLTRPRSRLAL